MLLLISPTTRTMQKARSEGEGNLGEAEELDEWRSGKRRRVECMDLEASGTTGVTTTAPLPHPSSGKSTVAQMTELVHIKKEAVEDLEDRMEDLEDINTPLQVQCDRLQTKIDAMFLVGACVAGGTDSRHDPELSRLGTVTLSQLRLLPPAATGTQVGKVVHGFLENNYVKVDAVKAGALGFTLRVEGSSRTQMIQLIMAQKFSACGV